MKYIKLQREYWKYSRRINRKKKSGKDYSKDEAEFNRIKKEMQKMRDS